MPYDNECNGFNLFPSLISPQMAAELRLIGLSAISHRLDMLSEIVREIERFPRGLQADSPRESATVL